MNLGFLARVLRERRALRSHEWWNRAAIAAHQGVTLTEIRRCATDCSPFYKRFHAGYASRPLGELAVLTKGQLIASFDDLVTDRNLHVAEVREFLAALEG